MPPKEVSELHDISQPFGLASCHEQRLLLMAAPRSINHQSCQFLSLSETLTQNVQALDQNLIDNPNPASSARHNCHLRETRSAPLPSRYTGCCITSGQVTVLASWLRQASLARVRCPSRCPVPWQMIGVWRCLGEKISLHHLVYSSIRI